MCLHRKFISLTGIELRTSCSLDTRQMLYQLSYQGVVVPKHQYDFLTFLYSAVIYTCIIVANSYYDVFLISFRSLKPSMMQRLLRKLIIDVPILADHTFVALKVTIPKYRAWSYLVFLKMKPSI